MEKKVKKTWYHISPKNLGKKKIFIPRGQSHALPFEHTVAAHIKRICVAPSIKHCLLALSNSYKKGSVFYAYKTRITNADTKNPKKLVNDGKTTKEAWILKSCSMRLAGKIIVLKEGEVKWKTRKYKYIECYNCDHCYSYNPKKICPNCHNKANVEFETDDFSVGINSVPKFEWIEKYT